VTHASRTGSNSGSAGSSSVTHLGAILRTASADARPTPRVGRWAFPRASSPCLRVGCVLGREHGEGGSMRRSDGLGAAACPRSCRLSSASSPTLAPTRAPTATASQTTEAGRRRRWAPLVAPPAPRRRRRAASQTAASGAPKAARCALRSPSPPHHSAATAPGVSLCAVYPSVAPLIRGAGVQYVDEFMAHCARAPAVGGSPPGSPAGRGSPSSRKIGDEAAAGYPVRCTRLFCGPCRAPS
jgi:hypothetical protein